MSRTKRRKVPKPRSEVAVAMHNRGGQGIHGGDNKAGKRTKNKRGRKDERLTLKKGRWDAL